MEYCFSVIKPGLLSTVQDLGRHDYRIYGVSASGAMDPFSLRIGNMLVGNDEGMAAIEATLIGPRIRFEIKTVIALTGGNLSPKINNTPVQMWSSIPVNKGDELSFGKCEFGCRTYIAFSGGINVPEVMGSRSTFTRGEYGGFKGRALKVNDVVPLGKPNFDLKRVSGRKLGSTYIPDYKTNRPVRFILGPHDKRFTQNSLERFRSEQYELTNNSDRMGYRLTGEEIVHMDGADIISDFIAIGTIQVPGSQQPIIHMADCGTSGGYTKLGVVVSTDIPYLAQKKPGDTIAFEEINVRKAQQELQEQEQLLFAIRLNNL